MSKQDELFERKLEAYFHDSPDKPFILLTGESHWERAKEISEKMGIEYSGSKGCDIVASSMERFYLPKSAGKNKDIQVVFNSKPEFIHPLSGKRYCEFKKMDKNIFKKAVDDAVEELLQKEFKNDFEKFVYVWRYLCECLKNHTPNEYKKYWDVAPADTRFPNHTIFEHLKVTSSINSDRFGNINLNNMTLFILTIGPVQEYIAQARKTQDLYWGSYILSYLAWVAIEKVIEMFGPDSVIFPDLIEQPLCDLWLAKLFGTDISDVEGLKTPTIPNRFFALLPTKNIEEIKSLKLEETIKNEFERMGNYILDDLLNCNSIQRKLFGKQLKNFPQVYWIALPLENGEMGKADWEVQLDKIKDYFPTDEIAGVERLLRFIRDNGEYSPNIGNMYGLLYSFMEKVMGARKGVRNFVQYEEAGRKCSICGEYNAVVYRCTKDEDEKIKNGKESYKIALLKNQGTIIKGSRDRNIPYKYLSQGEGLCSICFTKRAAEIYFEPIIGKDNIEEAFPSTAEIALLDVLNNPDDELRSLIYRYKKIFEDCGDNFDYELLYGENLNEAYFERYDLHMDRLLDLKKLLKDIDDRINELKLNKKKYYAVVKLDGDDMGKWLSGRLAPAMLSMYHSKVQNYLPEDFKAAIAGTARLMTPDVHAAISKALKNYSLRYVKEAVESLDAGKVIYSGGDDVLAVVNLDSLFDVMLKLRAAFSGHLNDSGRPDFTSDTGFVEYNDRIDMLMGCTATASMGVAIAHYKEDLREVIASANYAEEECAKKKEGKDAFSINLILRSGESYTATAKWKYDDISCTEGTIGLLKDIALFFKNGTINTSFIQKLKSSLSGLDLLKLPDGVFSSELRRNIIKSLNNRLGEKEKERAINELYDLMSLLYKEVDYDNFIGLLSILVFLNRGDKKNVVSSISIR